MADPTQTKTERTPQLSLVMPCYNEEACLELTVGPLVETFENAGIDLEVILVDNGSSDQTSAVIDRLVERGLPVIKGAVPVNRGQGLGIRTGLQMSRGRSVGYLAADGQVSPESVLLIYRSLCAADNRTLAKVRRRFRPDSWIRKVVSTCYNVSMLILFPGLPSLDVNGSPRIMSAEIIRLMDLKSDDWFLEAEILLKAHYLRLMVIEIDVPGRLRKGGRSNVGLNTILEFIANIAKYRFGGPWRQWRKQVSEVSAREVHAL
jgi:glycosyltransferase involved in cell wall biosynthesis